MIYRLLKNKINSLLGRDFDSAVYRSTFIFRKWYFATNCNGIKYSFDQISAAILSANKNTTLAANLIFDDEYADDEVNERIKWIEAQGVRIIRHRSLLLSELIPQFGERMKVYSGHWLRCDIPLLEKEDEFVLYTDIDVIFLRDPIAFAFRTSSLACGAEHNRSDFSYFNSGVMIINVPDFRKRREAMLGILKSRLSTSAPYDDQGMLNELFLGRWDHLSDEWNWKPYWGGNSDAIIVHFHGPKPNNVAEMLGGESGKFGREFETIFLRNIEGYKYYMNVLQEFRVSCDSAM